MNYDVIVIGAGQAGLSMGYYLTQKNASFLLLDQENEVGESWKKRYDSLVLFTPRRYSALPGLTFPGNQESFPTKDEVADYLKCYAAHWQLPIQHGTTVTSLKKQEEHFTLDTNNETYYAKQVVVATGPFHTPFVPKISQELSQDVYQLHSSDYQREQQLPPGPVLVVGGGNSGAQIAVELSKTRKTYLSVGQNPTFLPLTIGGKSIFWFMDKLGIYRKSPDSWVGKKLQKKADPLFGSELKKALAKQEITLLPRTMSTAGSRVVFENGQETTVQNVIWSTGFIPSYEWIDIPNVLDEKGRPVHEKGVTPQKGLYFLGLPWQTCRGSALLLGVGNDAEALGDYIAAIKKDA